MSETVVRVDLRQATLSENARLRDAGELQFLALENPPPVRSLLKLSGEGEPTAFEVARVIEVVDEDELARGCYGRTIELGRLDEQHKVGSEHLEPGNAGGGGVPAPVMMFGDTDDSGEYRAARDEGESGDADDEASASEESESESEASEESDSSGSEASESEESESEASEESDD